MYRLVTQRLEKQRKKRNRNSNVAKVINYKKLKILQNTMLHVIFVINLTFKPRVFTSDVQNASMTFAHHAIREYMARHSSKRDRQLGMHHITLMKRNHSSHIHNLLVRNWIMVKLSLQRSSSRKNLMIPWRELSKLLSIGEVMALLLVIKSGCMNYGLHKI